MLASPQHIAIVVNPLAGSGRALFLATELSRALDDRNISFEIFSHEWPARFSGFSDIWIVGGDGTLHFFINKYPDLHLPLALFKGGSGNDFHWLLYKEMSWMDQVEYVLFAGPRPVDAGRCNGRLFLNNCGIGFEGAVAKSLMNANKLQGKTTFMLAVLKKIFSYRSQQYQIKADGHAINSAFLIVHVSNGRRAGGGFHIAPEASAQDGLLNMVLVNKMPVLSRLRWLPVIEKGKHLELPFVKHWLIGKATIQCGTEADAHMDGEYYSFKEFEIDILPGKFMFRF